MWSHESGTMKNILKNETGERNVLIPLPNVTASGLKIRDWIERLVTVLEKESRGLEVGPAICDYDGFVMPWATAVNSILHESLRKLQLRRPDSLFTEGPEEVLTRGQKKLEFLKPISTCIIGGGGFSNVVVVVCQICRCRNYIWKLPSR